MDKVGVFCNETLSNYEKTIYSMAIASSESGKYKIKDEDVAAIAARLCLNVELLNKAMNYCPDGYIPYKTIQMGKEFVHREQFKNSDLFDALVWIHFVYKNLSQISDGCSYRVLLNNYQLLQDSIGIFSTINMITSTFECMKNDCYAYSYAVFNSGKYQPEYQLNLLRLGMSGSFNGRFGENFFPFLCRIMSYELITRINSVYLITINQVVKHSNFFDESVKSIAGEMYCYLLGLAQNARVISMQTNYLPPLHPETPECRGRYDNTTRLQVLYGYGNFDAYYLRLDLAHKGQGFVHYNNKSLGGIKCCLFSQKEYTIILDETPQTEKFFIEYDGRYALKEPHNIEWQEDDEIVYESIRKNKEHAQAFANIYNETAIVDFVNIIASMLPASCRVPMDVDEELAQNCFHYEKIMFYSVLLEIAILSENELQKEQALECIAFLAEKYGIINAAEKDEYACIEGVCFIIDEVKSKIPFFNNLY